MSLFDKHSNATTIEELKQEWNSCEQCPFYTDRKNVVLGSGLLAASIFAVGQYPGKDEDLRGVPFIGRGGIVTKQQFAKIGIPNEEVWYTNVLACKPFDWLGVRQTWVDHCWDRLDAELRIVKPKMIVAMGTPAAKRFIPKLPKKGEARGREFTYKDIPGISILHPAALLRVDKNNQNKIQTDVNDDFERLKILYKKVTQAC